jgi:ribosome-associated translation inhibitor RaiA
MAAIDGAVDKLHTQVSKSRDKKFGNKMHATETIRAAEVASEAEAEEET